ASDEEAPGEADALAPNTLHIVGADNMRPGETRRGSVFLRNGDSTGDDVRIVVRGTDKNDCFRSVVRAMVFHQDGPPTVFGSEAFIDAARSRTIRIGRLNPDQRHRLDV